MDYLNFDGLAGYAEIPNNPDLSVGTTGALTVAAFMRPATVSFPNIEGSGYVHWMGKGESGRHEWVLRMYSQPNDEKRANRISFYVFNQEGRRGVGAYVQEPVTPGVWIHIVGVADGECVHLFKNGVLKNTQRYADEIRPQHGTAPLRLGTRDFNSFFQGSLAQIRIWNRALSPTEISGATVPQTGLVAEYAFMAGRDTARGHHAAIKGATWGTDNFHQA